MAKKLQPIICRCGFNLEIIEVLGWYCCSHCFAKINLIKKQEEEPQATETPQA